MGVLATDTLLYNHLSSFYLLKIDYFEEKNIIARLVWVLAPGSAQVHSTQISISIKLHEGLYGLQFVPVLNFPKYSTISCRHVHKMYSIVQLGPSPFCQTLGEKNP